MSADQHDSNKEQATGSTDSVTASAPVAKSPSANDVVEANSGSALNTLMWVLVLGSFVSATLVNQYLPAYWQPASSVWVRIGIIAGLVVFGVICFFLTKQGKGFSNLLSDSQTELRRVTWPTREETFEYTWKTLLVMVITGVLIWILDGVFNVLVGAIIGS